jgi:hypothetical protein
MVVYKQPKFENDSYMFVINLQTDALTSLEDKYSARYVDAKYKSFREKNISKEPFADFIDRPSLKDFDNLKDLEGSIYTYTCQSKNKLDYNHIIKFCKKFHNTSRRCAINFADTLHDYLDQTKNTSCLNSIHFYKDNVTVYFRASDIKNELLLDLCMIIDFFVTPVGDFKTLTVMCSTAQNIETKLQTLIL